MSVLNPGVRVVEGRYELRGIFAERPSASDVPVGSVFYAVDTGNVSITNGEIWSTLTQVKAVPLSEE
jgi:hypothetical protein